jgi:hypothetical protein
MCWRVGLCSLLLRKSFSPFRSTTNVPSQVVMLILTLVIQFPHYYFGTQAAMAVLHRPARLA